MQPPVKLHCLLGMVAPGENIRAEEINEILVDNVSNSATALSPSKESYGNLGPR